MRGHHFKSTHSRSLYQLLCERNQVSLFDSLSVSLHDENVVEITLKNVKSEPVPSESHLFAFYFDERDDIPLASLLKKGLFTKAGSAAVSSPTSSVHCNSSSSYNVFVPTSG